MDDLNIKFIEGKDKKSPLVIINSFDSGNELIKLSNECKKDFHLLIISNLSWNDDLTPWKAEGIFSSDSGYKGLANTYLNYLVNVLIPNTKSKYELLPESFIIGGYSLAGLFALYSSTKVNLFSGAFSCSGSLWYPRFIEYLENNKISKDIKFIYLSLGDKEKNTRNQYLKETENCHKQCLKILEEQNIKYQFEYNKGNHFTEANQRTIKGLINVLENL